jgi:hypothetical protein
MTDDIPTIDIPDLVIVDAPGQAPVRATIGRMVDVLKKGKPAPERPTVDVSAAFDRGFKGADLVLDEPTPIFPKNPVPSGSKKASTTYRPKGGSTRPPGAEDLQGLFATGLILLLVFAVGEWASPTADEAMAISGPLSNIIARRIDLAARLGKDASDTIALAVAVLSYLARVGPIGAERVSERLEQRRRREGVLREPTKRPDDGGGAGGMAFGQPVRESTAISATYNPFDAITSAQRNGLNQLDRDFGYAERPDNPVGDVR